MDHSSNVLTTRPTSHACPRIYIKIAERSAHQVGTILSYLQDAALAANNGGSTAPSVPSSGKKSKKSRGKEADTGNGDAGTVENSEAAPHTSRVVMCFFLLHSFSEALQRLVT